MREIAISAPVAGAESPILTVWPTIGAMAWGRIVGRLSGIRPGYCFFILGKLLALATIPVSLAVFCWQLMPWVCRRYAVTSRRVIIRKGLSGIDGPSIGLNEFDAIDILVLPGQAWLQSGDVIFTRGGSEVLRLSGVSRPEIFRQTCLKVKTAMEIGPSRP
jgi:hypothetical protein